MQLGVTCILMTLIMIPLCSEFLPKEFVIQGVTDTVSRWDAFLCVACGLFGGCMIGFITEYYTSHSYGPVRDVAYSCETGAATNIIFGLALGYKSCILPITIIALNVFFAFKYAGMYGVALSALGFLGTLSTCLSIDVYGPVRRIPGSCVLPPRPNPNLWQQQPNYCHRHLAAYHLCFLLHWCDASICVHCFHNEVCRCGC